MQLKRNQKGFTLIEVLIVIILLGIIITFMFKYGGNIFSNASTQSSASKIVDDFRVIDDAASRYQMDKAANATALSGAATTLTVAVTSSGTPYLSSIPTPPSSGVTTGSSYTWDNATYTNTWGTAAADTVIALTTITSTEVCSEINRQFAGGASGAVPPAAVQGTPKDIQCFGPVGGPYTALKTIYVQ